MRAHDLGAAEPPNGHVAPGPDRKRTGRARLAGDIGGNRKAAADPVIAAALENGPVMPLEIDESAKLAPSEPRIRASACGMHRIVGSIAGARHFPNPCLWIIVEPKQSGASPGKARMIEKREIFEAELGRGIA
jgi:hypothetical protein